MAEENEENQEQQVEESQDNSNETQEQNVAPEQEQTDNTEETQETQEAPKEGEEAESEEVSSSYDDLPDLEPGQPIYQSVPFDQLPREEDGTIKAEAFQKWQENERNLAVEESRRAARDEFARMKQAEKTWKEVEKNYPAIAKNPALRKAIHKVRIGDVASGGKGDLVAAAKEVMGPLEETNKSAANSAKETIRVQQSAQLDTSSNVASTTSADRKSAEETLSSSRNRREREAATESILKDMMDKNEI